MRRASTCRSSTSAGTRSPVARTLSKRDARGVWPLARPPAGDRDTEAHDALDGLLVIHRVAALADDREVVQQRVDGSERATGQDRQLNAFEPPPHLALVDRVRERPCPSR